MGFDTKNTARVGGGNTGLSPGLPGNPISYITGNLSGQDGTGFEPVGKQVLKNENFRAETSDTLKRRTVGFRGL